CPRDALGFKPLTRQFSKNVLEREVDRRRVVGGIEYDDISVAGDLAKHFAVHPFAETDRFEYLEIFLPDKQTVALLIFSDPDFKHRHRFVTYRDLANVDLASGGFHQLREDITRATGALVMNAFDRIVLAQLGARLDDSVDPILHFGVAALYGLEVEPFFLSSVD